MNDFLEMFFTIEPDAIESMIPPLSGEEEYIQLD